MSFVAGTAGHAAGCSVAICGSQGSRRSIPCVSRDRMWRGARRPLIGSDIEASVSAHPGTRSFALGLATQISNPKTAVVYASVFAAFLPATSTVAFNLCVVGLVFLIEAGWYAFVAVALSSERPRYIYLRYKTSIDRTAGAVMIALGLRLATSSR